MNHLTKDGGPITILGIDPGSRFMGYGIISVQGQQTKCLHADTLKLGDAPFHTRLGHIYATITTLIQDYQPDEVAIEEVFVRENVQSALKLGHARGAAMTAVVVQSCPIFEYAPRQIKQAVVGTGRADKAQVNHMVRALLNLSQRLSADTADALAIALCHSIYRASPLQALHKGVKTT